MSNPASKQTREQASANSYRIMDLAVSDRPRERLAEAGPQALSNAELLAILLRVGVQGENAVQVATRLLGEFGGLAGIHRASLEEVAASTALVWPRLPKSRRLSSWPAHDRGCPEEKTGDSQP